jgi:hypothetical protein
MTRSWQTRPHLGMAITTAQWCPLVSPPVSMPFRLTTSGVSESAANTGTQGAGFFGATKDAGGVPRSSKVALGCSPAKSSCQKEVGGTKLPTTS